MYANISLSLMLFAAIYRIIIIIIIIIIITTTTSMVLSSWLRATVIVHPVHINGQPK